MLLLRRIVVGLLSGVHYFLRRTVFLLPLMGNYYVLQTLLWRRLWRVVKLYHGSRRLIFITWRSRWIVNVWFQQFQTLHSLLLLILVH
ncbi:unnamed protein product [Cuscuta campestris]|uniref:Uncharacterized protein n=1 Tax=Cuscuta campestris TaxID=132261 RepID=A0A484KN07_9ASTE|nr:unnamed protein product [Cuscuta campestris]